MGLVTGAPPLAEIDCPWSRMAGFEMNPITEDKSSAERKPGLGAIALHKFINGVPATCRRSGPPCGLLQPGFACPVRNVALFFLRNVNEHRA